MHEEGLMPIFVHVHLAPGSNVWRNMAGGMHCDSMLQDATAATACDTVRCSRQHTTDSMRYAAF
jgi:hypothetical protein